jgi:uncharacterized protein (TIGR02646 family)
MRFIDLERLEDLQDWPPGKHPFQKYTPQRWEARLLQAQEELRNAADSETWRKIFTKYSDLWSDVKIHLRTQSHDKCWYCETSTRAFPGDIDHYRPKGNIAETADHVGYWWLAFEWRNWRFVCRYCNSLNRDFVTGEVSGKGDSFPLLRGEAYRIKGPDEYEYYEELLREYPKLLDPTEREDTALLTFTSEGVPEPVEENEQQDTYERARASIEIYHLDSSRLKNERKKIFVQVKRHVEDYQRFIYKWETEHDYSAYALARRAGKALGRMIAKDAEYSMAAIAYLKEHFQRHPDWTWIYTLLTSPSEPIYASIYVPVTGVESGAPGEPGETA